MSILDAVKTRLEDQTAIQRVETSLSFERAQQASLTEAEAWVLPLDTVAGPNTRGTQGVMQDVTLTVGILLKVRMPGDVSGAQALGALETDKTAVQAALLGWTPAGADEPLVYAGGDLLGLKESEVWWLEQYQTNYLITGNGA